MNLSDIVTLLSPQILAAPADPRREVSGGYAGDLLSCVMARARAGNIWITVQAHPNVVAVASLLDLAGVIIAELAPVDAATVQKAQAEGIALFETPLTTYAVVAKLARAGLAGMDA